MRKPLLSIAVLSLATTLAVAQIRSGLADARAGKPPYFWALLTDHGQLAKNAAMQGWSTSLNFIGPLTRASN